MRPRHFGALLVAATLAAIGYREAAHGPDPVAEGAAAARAGLSERDNPYLDGGPRAHHRRLRGDGLINAWLYGFGEELRARQAGRDEVRRLLPRARYDLW